MRYAVATLVALLTLLAGVALAGAGHGWMGGAIGCLVLAPVSFLAWVNALGSNPSPRTALTIVFCGLAACLMAMVLTISEGTEHFSRFFRITGPLGGCIAGLALLGWLTPLLLVVPRARSKTRADT